MTTEQSLQCEACQYEGRSCIRIPGILIALKPLAMHVERCDACERFDSDRSAFDYVVSLLSDLPPDVDDSEQGTNGIEEDNGHPAKD